MSDFNILVLGSGAATPTHNRHCSGQLVSICGKKILVDCGESTQDSLRKYHQKFQGIRMIFISHLHGDHFFGLPGLLSTMHLCGRTEPLTVFAPKGAKDVLGLLFEVSGTGINYPLDFVELELDSPQVVYSEEKFHVTAFPLRHSVPTYGYLFEEETPLMNLRPGVRDKYQMTNDWCMRVKRGEDMILDSGEVIANELLAVRRHNARRYAYCCDTAFDETLIPILEGVNLLCMESTFDNTFIDLAAQRQHCTAEQAATIANRAGVGQLMLTHFSARYKDIEPLLAEARSVFPNTVSAEDGSVYEL